MAKLFSRLRGVPRNAPENVPGSEPGRKRFARYDALACALLGMPADATADGIEIGVFRPADSEAIVRECCSFRLRHLSKLLAVSGLEPEVRREITCRQFYHPDDYAVSLKAAEPRGREGVPLGRDRDHARADLAGYLAHVAERDPAFAGVFTRRLPVRLAEENRRRHTYVVGASGCGKSELLKLIIHAYLRKPESERPTVIVIDPHGDFAGEVAKWQENRGGECLCLIDPLLADGQTPTVNPFDLRDRSERNIDIRAQELIAVFKELLENTGLTNQMEALLFPCLTVLLRMPGTTLLDLQRFMDEDLNDEYVRWGLHSANDAHRNFFASMFGTSTYKATKASIFTKIQSLINSQTFYDLTCGKSTVDIGALMDSRKLVVFNLAKGTMGKMASAAFGRFVIALIQGHALGRQALPRHARVPTHLFIDECHNYISESIERILTESRKYALHVTLAQQSVGQEMGARLRDIVLTNTNIRMYGKADPREDEERAGLKKGMFRVQCDTNPTFTLYCPTDLLGQRNAMTNAEWEAVRAHQLTRYYRPVHPGDEEGVEMIASGSFVADDGEAVAATGGSGRERGRSPAGRKEAPRTPALAASGFTVIEGQANPGEIPADEDQPAAGKPSSPEPGERKRLPPPYKFKPKLDL